MQLEGYTPVPANATLGGAPIDAFQANAFRENDVLFEGLSQAILSSPLVPSGVDGDIPNDDNPLRVYHVFNAKTITVASPINFLTDSPPDRYRMPLIWLAREKITISANIDATGNGGFNSATAGTEIGDFGGSGGGSNSAAGAACNLPFIGTEILPGGTSSNNGVNVDDDAHQAEAWASRSLVYLPFCKGGAAGAGADGGAGGGVVFLCAPIIEIVGSAEIDASGADATGTNSGGGGGGLIVLTAREFINVNRNGNVKANGGAKHGSGGDGGAGHIWIRRIS